MFNIPLWSTIKHPLSFFNVSASGGDSTHVFCHHWRDVNPGPYTQTAVWSLFDTRPSSLSLFHDQTSSYFFFGASASVLRASRSFGQFLIHVHHVLPASGKGLTQYISHSELISWILEGYDVVGVPGNTLGVFAGWKHVLAQVQHGDVFMIRMVNKSSKSLSSPPSAIRSSYSSNPPFGDHDLRWSDSAIPS